MAEYPEHEKLQKVHAQTQAVGEFLEWANEQGICLLQYDDKLGWFPPRRSMLDLLAEWKGIDRDKLEAEKRTMLAEIRRTHE